MQDSSNKHAGIVRRQTEDYNLFIKDDGTDYEQIWSDFRQRRLQDVVCININKSANVYRVKALDRYFIIKVDWGYPHYLDSKIRRILKGPFYSNQMTAINRAVNAGAKSVTDFYLVAEKRSGLITRKSYIIMEFLDGHGLNTEADHTKFHDEMIKVISELHKHRMALCDVNPFNFFITDQGVRVIDLSARGAFWSGKAKDAFFLKRFYGIDFPLNGPLEKFAVRYVGAMLKMRHAMRRFRKFVSGQSNTKKGS